MAGLDTRDPKLGKMNDGSVLLTFFVPGGRVFYSVWMPVWTRFTASCTSSRVRCRVAPSGNWASTMA